MGKYTVKVSKRKTADIEVEADDRQNAIDIVMQGIGGLGGLKKNEIDWCDVVESFEVEEVYKGEN